MNGYGNENGFMNNSFHKEGESHRNSRLPQAQAHHQGNTEKRHIMETLDRGYSDLYRNSSEEIVLKSLMENPMGISAPSMEMLGFKNISQTLRGDSEELFNSWLLNGEARILISLLLSLTHCSSNGLCLGFGQTSLISCPSSYRENI